MKGKSILSIRDQMIARLIAENIAEEISKMLDARERGHTTEKGNS